MADKLQQEALREARAGLIAHDLAVLALLVLQRQEKEALELARDIEIQFDKSGEPIALGRRVEVKDE